MPTLTNKALTTFIKDVLPQEMDKLRGQFHLPRPNADFAPDHARMLWEEAETAREEAEAEALAESEEQEGKTATSAVEEDVEEEAEEDKERKAFEAREARFQAHLVELQKEGLQALPYYNLSPNSDDDPVAAYRNSLPDTMRQSATLFMAVYNAVQVAKSAFEDFEKVGFKDCLGAIKSDASAFITAEESDEAPKSKLQALLLPMVLRFVILEGVEAHQNDLSAALTTINTDSDIGEIIPESLIEGSRTVVPVPAVHDALSEALFTMMVRMGDKFKEEVASDSYGKPRSLIHFFIGSQKLINGAVTTVLGICQKAGMEIPEPLLEWLQAFDIAQFEQNFVTYLHRKVVLDKPLAAQQKDYRVAKTSAVRLEDLEEKIQGQVLADCLRVAGKLDSTEISEPHIIKGISEEEGFVCAKVNGREETFWVQNQKQFWFRNADFEAQIEAARAENHALYQTARAAYQEKTRELQKQLAAASTIGAPAEDFKELDAQLKQAKAIAEAWEAAVHANAGEENPFLQQAMVLFFEEKAGDKAQLDRNLEKLQVRHAELIAGNLDGLREQVAETSATLQGSRDAYIAAQRATRQMQEEDEAADQAYTTRIIELNGQINEVTESIESLNLEIIALARMTTQEGIRSQEISDERVLKVSELSTKTICLENVLLPEKRQVMEAYPQASRSRLASIEKLKKAEGAAKAEFETAHLAADKAKLQLFLLESQVALENIHTRLSELNDLDLEDDVRDTCVLLETNLAKQWLIDVVIPKISDAMAHHKSDETFVDDLQVKKEFFETQLKTLESKRDTLLEKARTLMDESEAAIEVLIPSLDEASEALATLKQAIFDAREQYYADKTSSVDRYLAYHDRQQAYRAFVGAKEKFAKDLGIAEQHLATYQAGLNIFESDDISHDVPVLPRTLSAEKWDEYLGTLSACELPRSYQLRRNACIDPNPSRSAAIANVRRVREQLADPKNAQDTIIRSLVEKLDNTEAASEPALLTALDSLAGALEAASKQQYADLAALSPEAREQAKSQLDTWWANTAAALVDKHITKNSDLSPRGFGPQFAVFLEGLAHYLKKALIVTGCLALSVTGVGLCVAVPVLKAEYHKPLFYHAPTVAERLLGDTLPLPAPAA